MDGSCLKTIQSFILSYIHREEANYKLSTAALSKQTKKDSEWEENVFISNTYFQLRQIHNVNITVATAVFVVPGVGDIVGQIVQINL